MEYNAQGMSYPGLYLTYSMFHVDTVVAFCSFFWFKASCKDQGVSTFGLEDNRFGLCSWNLLSQDKLTS